MQKLTSSMFSDIAEAWRQLPVVEEIERDFAEERDAVDIVSGEAQE